MGLWPLCWTSQTWGRPAAEQTFLPRGLPPRPASSLPGDVACGRLTWKLTSPLDGVGLGLRGPGAQCLQPALSLQFADGVYLVLLMGLLEGYFVPLHSFFLTPDSFEQKVRRGDVKGGA